MNPLQNHPLTRKEIATFIPSLRGVIAFEATQGDTKTVYDGLTGGSFLTLGGDPLGNERTLTLAAADLTATDDGAGGAYTVALAAAGTAGTYGNPAGFVTLTTDSKGRVIDVATFALSASSGIAYNDVTGVFTAVPAGTYGTPTGTLTRTTFSAGPATGASAAYVQAEANAALARIAELEQRLAALITDLQANGNLA